MKTRPRRGLATDIITVAKVWGSIANQTAGIWAGKLRPVFKALRKEWAARRKRTGTP